MGNGLQENYPGYQGKIDFSPQDFLPWKSFWKGIGSYNFLVGTSGDVFDGSLAEWNSDSANNIFYSGDNDNPKKKSAIGEYGDRIILLTKSGFW